MSNEDEDISRAIALSLQESSKKPALINLDSDEDEDEEEARFQEELQKALEVSKSQSQSSPYVSDAHQHAPAEASTSASTSTFLSERAQLERERRERQKRLRPQASRSSLKEPTDDDDDNSDLEGRPAKRQRSSASSSSTSLTRSNMTSSSHSKPPKLIPTIEQVFWNGELRQTATQHAEPRKDGVPSFRLTEVLGKKSEVEFAIMSSYSLDFPWIYEFFDRSVPVIMVAQPDESGAATIKNVLPNWIRTTPFLRGGRGCQHMKFMLLFYKTGRLRVVISTANLIAYDWRDMENTVWLQDLPLRGKPIPHDPKATDFPAVLQHMLYAVNVKPALSAMIADNHPNLPIQSIDGLRQRWDWSNIKVQLVASIAGKHEGWPSVIRTGHPRLMTAVRRLGMRTGKAKQAKDLALECQGSSLGFYTTQWLNEFHWSARGESAEDWLDNPKKSREKLPLPSVKIVFPTKTTVQGSALGEQGGGTIFCRRKQWTGKNFPRNQFYDSKSKAGPVLMHSKMIVAMLQNNPFSEKRKTADFSDSEDETDDDDIEVVEPAAGWAYIGSHNFTPSAWGTISGSSFNPTLNVSNYEVGIVFLLKDAKEADRIACFQRPPKKYTSKDEAWIQEDSAFHQPE